jgi:excisionase family DNA binding protein
MAAKIIVRRQTRDGSVEQAAPPRPLRLMSVKDAGAYAKVSTQSIRRWIRTGRLKIYRAGRQIRINEADLVDLLSPQELKWW